MDYIDMTVFNGYFKPSHVPVVYIRLQEDKTEI